jgi:hypothetical protein
MGTAPSGKERPCLSQPDRHYNQIAVFTLTLSGAAIARDDIAEQDISPGSQGGRIFPQPK